MIRFFFKNERKQKSRVVYPLTAQQQAYVGQFPTAETLCAALKAAAGAAGGAAAGPAASSTSSALTSTSRSAHGYGVQCIKAAWRSYIYIDNTNCYLPGSHTMAAAQAMRDAAVVCWVRYLHMRGLSQAIIPAMNVPLVEWEADGGARFATFLEGLGADARRAFKDRIQAIIRASRIHTTS